MNLPLGSTAKRALAGKVQQFRDDKEARKHFLSILFEAVIILVAFGVAFGLVLHNTISAL